MIRRSLWSVLARPILPGDLPLVAGLLTVSVVFVYAVTLTMAQASLGVGKGSSPESLTTALVAALLAGSVSMILASVIRGSLRARGVSPTPLPTWLNVLLWGLVVAAIPVARVAALP